MKIRLIFHENGTKTRKSIKLKKALLLGGPKWVQDFNRWIKVGGECSPEFFMAAVGREGFKMTMDIFVRGSNK